MISHSRPTFWTRQTRLAISSHVVNPHLAIREKGYFSILQGPEMSLGAVDTRTKRKLYPRKIHFFLIEKYIEDARQDKKHVLDLLESIMRPTDPVKDELRQKLFKMTQFESKSRK